MTGLVQVNLLGAPTAADVHAVLDGLATLLLAGGHLGLTLQAEHLNVLGTQTAGVARDIDSNVAAAHHNGAAGQRIDLAAVDLAQKSTATVTSSASSPGMPARRPPWQPMAT